LLSFSSNLSSILGKDSTQGYWYAKLYYDGETNFIGVSGKDRTIGSDFYHGIVLSWGSLRQATKIDSFEVSDQGISLKLANTPKAINGERFSDLYSTYGFTNRKWELFLGDERLSSGSDHQKLATGIIGGDTKFDITNFYLTLNNIRNKFDIEIPTTKITSSDAPDDNIGKPIPFVYGDFDRQSGLPSVFERHSGSKAPMIVTSQWDVTNGGVSAKADTEVLHTLRDKNIYIYNNGAFASFDDSLVTITNPNAYVSGNALQVAQFVTGVSEVANFDTSTTKVLSSDNNSVEFSIGVPEFPDLGTKSSLILVTDHTDDFYSPGSTDYFALTNSAGSVINNITSSSTSFTGGTSYIGSTVKIVLNSSDSGSSFDATFRTIMVILSYTFEDSIVQRKTMYVTPTATARADGKTWESGAREDPRTFRWTEEYNIPQDVMFYYGSMKGRKYNSNLTSGRSNGYATSDFIENPVYMVEDIARKFMGAGVDTTDFDSCGTKTTGTLKSIFNTTNASDVKFRFSHYAFEGAEDVLKKICRQSGLFHTYNESGDIRIFGRKRASSYVSGDVTQTLDFNDFTLGGVSMTPSNMLRNKVTVKYDYDYGLDDTTKETSVANDSTSQGATSSGNNKVNELIYDSPYISDQTTAENLRDTLLDYFKNRKTIIELETSRLKYSNIEVGDIVDISNFPSGIKVFGTALSSSDYFMVTTISLYPSGVKLTLTQVS